MYVVCTTWREPNREILSSDWLNKSCARESRLVHENTNQSTRDKYT